MNYTGCATLPLNPSFQASAVSPTCFRRPADQSTPCAACLARPSLRRAGRSLPYVGGSMQLWLRLCDQFATYGSDLPILWNRPSGPPPHVRSDRHAIRVRSGLYLLMPSSSQLPPSVLLTYSPHLLAPALRSC